MTHFQSPDQVYINTQSLSLDGVGDFLDSNTNMHDIIRCTSTAGWTLGGWIRLGDTTGLQTVYGSVNSTYTVGQFMLYLSGSNHVFLIRTREDDGTQKNSSLSFGVSLGAANEWHWFGITANVSGLSGSDAVPFVMYHADGPSGTITTKSASGINVESLNNFDTSVNMGVGTYKTSTSSSYHLNGQMDQMCVWNRALSSDEITELVANANNDYSQDFGDYTGSSNLVHYYKMDGDATDSGSLGSDGSLVNDATFTTSNIPIS